MSDQLAIVKVDALWRRALLLVPAALICFGAWTGLRWFVGDTMAAYPSSPEVARLAERIAPDDPQTHFTVGVFARNDFTQEGLNETVREFGLATALAPRDYRLWMELGRAREHAGDEAGGEVALRRAVELAPGYVMPRWYLGNLLLRAGRDEEAFAELRYAAASDRELRGAIFTSIWNSYGGDVERVTKAVGDKPAERAELVTYLVAQKRTDDALRLWSSIPIEDRRGQVDAGNALAGALIGAQHYGDALTVRHDTSQDMGAEQGRITNGSFEEEIKGQNKEQFGWTTGATATQSQLGIDAKTAHGGARSLRYSFNAPSAFNFPVVSQLVAVEPGAHYRLEFYARTENLKTASSLLVSVLTGKERRVLAASAPAPDGTNDWQQIDLDFTAPADTDGITVFIGRQPCSEGVCPIFGKIWYDDFNLQRAGAQPQQRRRETGAAVGAAAGGNDGRAR
jgi:tetratricopeptide (TPR) repeat protein